MKIISFYLAISLIVLSVVNAAPDVGLGTKIFNEFAKKRLREDTISSNVLEMEYAVRGQVVIAANTIDIELRKGKTEKPFKYLLYNNIGNPHSLGQKPLTWPRQVLALCNLPDECGVDHPKAHLLFPKDAIRRAKEIKSTIKGSGTGAYSHSQGLPTLREDVVTFLKKRDNLDANADDIFLTNGASDAVRLLMQTMISSDKCGIMVPIPQYPMYSAFTTLLGGKMIPYYLDEQKGWDLNIENLEKTLKEAEDEGITVSSFVLINPGNPTSQVLSKNSVQDICKFCAKHNLVLLADEVYQENVYEEGSEFYSCKLAAHEAGLLDNDSLELASFHSTSKGVFGECGRRGGYVELVGFDEKVKENLYKLASSSLCSNIDGQIMVSLMCRGPDPSDVSYESHEKEKKEIFESLKRRARIVSQGLNSIPGFSCEEAKGSMYCFPKIEMPPGAVQVASEHSLTADTLYCLDLLEHTGICVVPASGFGQASGRFGFRTTFLAPEAELEGAMKSIADHYVKFCENYSS